jgi:hypothetical protein
MKKNILAILGAVSFSLLFHCVGWNDIAGNGTLIGNPTVAGILYKGNGSPADSAIVHLRKKTFLPDVSRLGLFKRAPDSVSVRTDDSGRFLFDTTLALDTGTYVIEATRGTTAVLIDGILLTGRDSTVHLPPDTLKPTGAIKGVIDLSGGGEPQKMFVLAYGIDRAANVGADGSFSLPDLARGNYSLLVVSTPGGGAAPDTGIVVVYSAETTDARILAPPVAGNGTPVNGSTLTGALYHSDGSPARGITAFLHQYSNLPDSFFSSIDYQIIAEAGIVTYCITDESGNFSFDSLRTGTYAVEATSGNTTVLVDSLRIVNKGLKIHAAPDTLKPAGTLTGLIRHSNAGNVPLDSIYIFIIVGNLWQTVAYDNLRFIFNGLAEGRFQVRIISTLAAYPPRDAGTITIKRGDTTDIGEINLTSTTAAPVPH